MNDVLKRYTVPTGETKWPGVVFVPSPPAVVTAMLKLADVRRDDVVFDLGSGDGRVAIAAARESGARATGVELDAELVEVSVEAARAQGVAHLVTFRHGDLFSCDLHGATVVILYLRPDMNLQLRDKLRRELPPGARVISHTFDIEGWMPHAETDIDGHRLFRWTLDLWRS